MVNPGFVISIENSDGQSTSHDRGYIENQEFDHEYKNANLHDYAKNSSSDSIYDQKYITKLVGEKVKSDMNFKEITKQDFKHKNSYIKFPKGEDIIYGSKYNRKHRKQVDKLSDRSLNHYQNLNEAHNSDSSFDRSKKLIIK